MAQENQTLLAFGCDTDGNGDSQQGWYHRGEGYGVGLPYAYWDEQREGDGGASLRVITNGAISRSYRPAPPFSYRLLWQGGPYR